MRRSRFALVATMGLSLAAGGVARAGHRDIEIVLSARDVLAQATESPDRGIPRSMLRNAAAVAIIPGVIKAGFVVGGRFGRGVLVVKESNGVWSNPIFVSIAGGSVGWQIGAQSTDLILIFKTRAGVERVMRGKGKITLGVDAAVAAGPVGRDTSAGTDVQLRAEIFSYSRSRGLFAGVSVDGAGLKIDWTSNEHYYERFDITIDDIITGRNTPIPPSALELRQFMASLVPPPAVPAAPPGALSPAGIPAVPPAGPGNSPRGPAAPAIPAVPPAPPQAPSSPALGPET